MIYSLSRLWSIQITDPFTSFWRTWSTDANDQGNGYKWIKTKPDRIISSGMKSTIHNLCPRHSSSSSPLAHGSHANWSTVSNADQYESAARTVDSYSLRESQTCPKSTGLIFSFVPSRDNVWIVQNYAQAHILLTHAIDILSPLHHQDMAIGQLLKYLHYDRLLFDLNEATFRQTFLDHDNQLWDTCHSFLMENHSDNGRSSHTRWYRWQLNVFI